MWWLFGSVGKRQETDDIVTKKATSKAKPAAKAAAKPAPKPVAKTKAQAPRPAPSKKAKPELKKPEVKKPEAKKPEVKAAPQPEPKPAPKPELKKDGKPVKLAPEKTPAKPAAGKPAPEAVAKKPDAKAAAKAPAAAALKGKAVPAKPDAKAAAKKGAEPAQPGTPEKPDPDAPLLDMSDAAVRKMVTKAKARGYVTYDELNRVLPSDKVSSEQIEDTMAMLNEMGINVIESEEQEEGDGENLPATTTGRQVAVKENEEETYDRTDDPVRMYLREMGSVELLSREGEIAIAKRIEAGRELMIGALCEGPLTFEALTVWRDELNEGKALLRDIIDLEAMYGTPGVEGAVVGPDGPVPGGPLAPNGIPVPPMNGAGLNGAALNGNGAAHPVPPIAPPPPPRPAPPPPKAEGAEGEPRAEGSEGGEAGEGGGEAVGEEDFDDENNLSLSAMEAALKPQVLATLDQIAGLYKKLGKLQDAQVEAALGADEDRKSTRLNSSH